MTKSTPAGRTENHNSSVTPLNPRYRPSTRQRAADLLRRHRLSLGRNPANQKTLTQIDFVQRTPRPEEFLDEADFQEIQSVEHGGGDTLEGMPAPPDMNENSRQKQKPKPRKRKSGHNIGRRRSGRGEEYHDRTLTQMVNVDMRHGIEDENLGDVGRKSVSGDNERSAQKRPACNGELIAVKREAAEGVEDEGDMERLTPTKKARRDDGVKTEEEGNEIVAGSIWSRPRDHANSQRSGIGQSQIFRKPQTPQKPRTYVVPSSQSPESPEIIFGSPRKVKDGPVPFPLIFSPDKPRGTAGSPLKHDEVVESSVRLSESPSPGEDMEDSQMAVHDSIRVDSTVNQSDPIPPSPLSPIKTEGDPPESLKTNTQVTQPPSRERQRSEPTKRKPVVIYETDCDESETEGFHDAVSQPQNNDEDSDRTLVPSSQPNHDNSLRNSDSCYPDHGPIDNDPDCTMRSDASLLYARQPLSYAYEKIHDTQNLGVDYTKLSGSPGATDDAPESDRPKPGPSEASSARNPPAVTMGTGIANLEEQKQQNSHQPSSPIVQIESSQRSEIEICASDASDSPSETKNVLTASQLLTDSLMESIPVPPAWLSNEDHTQDELVDR